MKFNIKQHTVYLTKHGSQAYGTALPGSDLDVKGFTVAPRNLALGWMYTGHVYEAKLASNIIPDILLSEVESRYGKEVDSSVYDIRQFCQMASSCNPNIIETLFVEDEDVIVTSEAGRLIRDHRDHFLSRLVRKTFSGYAFGQLKRLKTHRGYLLSPPSHKPTREEFGLAPQQKITADMMGAFDKMKEREDVELGPNVMELVQNEKRYKAALDGWNQYQHWKENRNEARAALEAQFGYDTKNAGHLVRLLRMCREILTGQGVKVRRPDAQEILAVRRGEWTYDALIAWAEHENREMDAACAASALPEEPDEQFLNDLCVEAQERFWSR